MTFSVYRILVSGIALAAPLLGQEWNALAAARGWARQDVTGAVTFYDPGSQSLRTWSKDGSSEGVLSMTQLGALPNFWCLDIRDQAWVVTGNQLFYVDKTGKAQKKEALITEVSDLAWDRTGFYLVYRSEGIYIEKRDEKKGDVLWTYGSKPKKGSIAQGPQQFKIAVSPSGQLLCTLGSDLNVLMVDANTGKEQGKSFLAYNNAAAPALQVFGSDRQPIRWWSQKGVLLANVPGSQMPQKTAGQFLAKLDLSQGSVEFMATGLDEGSTLIGVQDGEATFVKPNGGLAFLALK